MAQTPQNRGRKWRVRHPDTRDWCSFDTEVEARHQLIRWQAEALDQDTRQRQQQGSGPTLRDYREQTWLPMRRRQVTSQSYRAGNDYWNNWLADWPLADMRLRRITTDDVREWLAAIEDAGATPHNMSSARMHLSAIFTAIAAESKPWRRDNPVLKVPEVVLPVPVRHLTSWTDVQKLMQQSEHYALMWRTIAEAGLRSAEACGLTVDCLLALDTSEPTLHVRQVTERGSKVTRPDTKGRGQDSGRYVPISTDLARALQAHVAGRQTTARVFLSVQGDAMNYGNLWRVTDTAVRAAGLTYDDGKQLTLHSLRHYACTAWFDAHCPPQAIREWMGHSSLATTMRYAHTTPAAAAIARGISRG